MDLISRKEALQYLDKRRTYELMDDRNKAYGKGIRDAIKDIEAQPSVPAVPLDKLCEWLTANRVSIPCRLCEYDDAGECTVQNDMSKPCPNTTRDWRRVITNWMEGLDDHR